MTNVWVDEPMAYGIGGDGRMQAEYADGLRADVGDLADMAADEAKRCEADRELGFVATTYEF